MTPVVSTITLYCMDEKGLFQRIDRIIFLMEESSKQPSILVRVLNLAALVATVLSVVAVADIIRNWFGG